MAPDVGAPGLVATAGVTLAPVVLSELVSPASVGWLPRSRATSETTWSGPASAEGSEPSGAVKTAIMATSATVEVEATTARLAAPPLTRLAIDAFATVPASTEP